MTKITWTCDRCGKQQDTPEQMWEVQANLRSIDSRTYGSNQAQTKHKQEWCRVCCERYPFIFPLPKEAPAAAVAPSFEDFLREIIQDEIEAAKP